MSVNGVTSYAGAYQSYQTGKTDTNAKAETEAKKEASSNGVEYSSKMSKEERAALVEKLKADHQLQMDSFKSMVRDMFANQGIAIKNADDIWSMLAKGDYTVDAETAQKAKDAISEDGYWGVKQTSQRIFDMAVALSGGDEEGMDKMLAAFEKGFKQATKSWGRNLPDISQQTYEAVQQKFKDYKASAKTEE